VVRATGIEYQRRGICPITTPTQSFDTAGDAAALMLGTVEPPRWCLPPNAGHQAGPGVVADRIVGGTFTTSDEGDDARVFTSLAAAERGAGLYFVTTSSGA
jgi:hypothetical protein